MRWADFETAAPAIAGRMRERMDHYRIVLVGTTRADGTARISPVNPYLIEGDLMLGMIPGSRKAADLERDPRCVVHSVVTDHKGEEGEVKLRGLVAPVTPPDLRAAYVDQIEKEFGWRPGEPFPLWSFDVVTACLITYEGGQRVISWADTGTEGGP